MKPSHHFLDATFRLTGLTPQSEVRTVRGTMAASIIARWSSMFGGVSESREEITMTAFRSGMTLISCPYIPDAL
jgi:hypothetical protein